MTTPGGMDPGWTLQTLYLYIERQLQDLREYHNTSVQALRDQAGSILESMQSSQSKSERALEKRLDLMGTGISREEYNSAHASLVERVDGLQARIDKTEGKAAGISNLWMVLVAGISTLGVIITSVILITGR